MRKFRMSIILLIVGVSGSLLQAQDKYTTNQPSIKLTTGKESGKWQFNIYMDKADRATAWIDLNNNGTYDKGEEKIKFNVLYKPSITAKTITIYGKVTGFFCSYNTLTYIDVSKNNHLTSLFCDENKLTQLDVINNTKLKKLYCNGNNITTLKLPDNNELEELYCFANNLSSIDLSACNSLKELYCNQNNIERLDVSNCRKLIELSCDRNRLTALDVSKNVELAKLFCFTNDLSVLSLSTNKNLIELYCRQNKLTSLDLSENTELTTVVCSENSLNSLDVSKNTKLAELDCSVNKLDKLSVTDNGQLMSVYCFSNRIQTGEFARLLTSLADRNGSGQGEIFVIDTKDTGEQNHCLADDITKAKQKNWNIYDWQAANNNGKNPYEGEKGSSIQHTVLENSVSVYPIPARSVLSIRHPYSLSGKSLTVTDASGRVVMKTNTTSAEKEMTLDVTTLYNGVYFLRIEDKIIRFVVCR